MRQRRRPRVTQLRRLRAGNQRAGSVGDSAGRQHAGDGRIGGAGRVRDVAGAARHRQEGRADTAAHETTARREFVAVQIRLSQPRRAVLSQRRHRGLRHTWSSRRPALRKTGTFHLNFDVFTVLKLSCVSCAAPIVGSTCFKQG